VVEIIGLDALLAPILRPAKYFLYDLQRGLMMIITSFAPTPGRIFNTVFVKLFKIIARYLIPGYMH